MPNTTPNLKHWVRAFYGTQMLLVASLLLHFWRLDLPGEVVFDEVLFGGFAAHYFSGSYYFDIHPPHLKLLYALLAKWGGMPAGYAFPGHETAYPGDFYVWMRALPAFCGAMLPLLVTALSAELGAKKAWALAAGWLMLLDTALLANSRFIINDTVLLCLGATGWLCFAIHRRRGGWPWLPLAALALAAASSVKWTGLGFLLPVLLVMAYDGWAKSSLRGLTQAAAMVATLLAWHAVGFAIHLSLLPKPGPGNAFMSPAFNQRMAGSQANAQVEPLPIVEAIAELNRTMASSASRVATHPDASKWYSWPFGWHGIYFWYDRAPQNTARIYMLPNLGVWWPASFAMAYLLIALMPRAAAALTGREHQPIDRVDLLLCLAFGINFLPFVLIDRVMFLYHYFPALLVSLLALARLGSRIERPAPFIAALLLTSAALFGWMLPLVYGLPLSQQAHEARMLLPIWR